MSIQSSVHRGILGFVGALVIGALSLGGASSVLAGSSTTSVTQQITAGTLTASIGAGSLNTIPYSNGSQITTGTVHLDVVDATGSSGGWNVVVSSSAFVYGGTSPSGIAIPAPNFSISLAHAPSVDAGQVIDAVGGPKVVGGGSLDLARKTIQANSKFGSGSYGQDLDLSLNVPALSQAGTYTATLTVAISVGP